MRLASASCFRRMHLERALERHGVRIVLLERDVLAAVLDVGAEAADVGDDRLALGRLAERARQLEQLHRLGERDGVHLLPGPQAGEARLLLIVLGADLHERAEASHAHGDRLAARRIACRARAPAPPARARRSSRSFSTWLDEGLPELVERRGPLLLAARHRVELILHRRGEAVLHVAVEVMGEEAVDDLADVGRHEAPAVHLHVLAVLQRGDDGGVGRGPADAVLLQRLDQRGLGVARRRLGEMLLRRAAAVSATRIALAASAAARGRRRPPWRRPRPPGRRRCSPASPASSRWRAAGGARGPSGPASMSTATVSNTACAICEATARFQISAYSRYRSSSILPSMSRRRDGGRGRTDGLVRLLGVLRLGLVDARLLGHLVRAVEPRGDLADLLHRLGRQRHRVGTHVGDEADAALADVDALVELLREAHGAPRVEAELARGLLLQRRGGEGRRRVAPALLAVDGERRVSMPGRCAPAPRRGACRVRSTSRACASLVKLNCSTFAPRYSMQLQRESLLAVRRPRPRCVQYSCATKAAISSSRSQIMRSAGLCTRPADSPRRTFFHSSGERLKPTR